VCGKEDSVMQDQSSNATRVDLREPAPGADATARTDFGSTSDYRPGVYHYTPRPSDTSDRAARLVQTLGWFSVGLGIAQLLAPRRVSRAIGIGEHPNLMRAIGTREIASGVGILTRRKPTGWLWSRVAGDAMDMALLGAAARSNRSNATRRDRIGLAGAAVAGIAAIDLLTSMKAPEHDALGSALEFEKVIVVNRSSQECYRFWRNLEDLPRFMRHLEAVRVIDDRRSRWQARGPLGYRVEWESELNADELDAYLAWRSAPGADVDNEGSVRFERAPGGRGTLVHVWMRYRPPGGAAGALAAKLFGAEPSQQIDEDLRRFKWLIETGEIPTTVGQASGPRGAWNRFVIRKGAAG
jgi:uncharacterized membrane protein